MATAFNPRERDNIKEDLIAAAQKYAASAGMKHASVAVLAKEAGISKGAFYSFYESKEHLFLDMFERMHLDMYGSAERLFKENSALPAKERAAMAVRGMYRVFARYGLMTFMQEDLPSLLRKLPESVLNEHYHDDEKHLMQLLKASDITLTTSIENACATLRILLLAPMYKAQLGEGFEAALNILIHSACECLVA